MFVFQKPSIGDEAVTNYDFFEVNVDEGTTQKFNAEKRCVAKLAWYKVAIRDCGFLPDWVCDEVSVKT